MFSNGVPSPIANWISDWIAQELAGKPATPQQIGSLAQLMREEPIDGSRMARLASTIAFMDGGSNIGPLCVLAINVAETELNQLEPADVKAKPILDAFWPLHDVLFTSRSYALDQKLLDLLRPWEIRGSGHSQWANYVYAEVLHYQGKSRDGYEVFNQLLAERAEAYEPSEGLNRPIDYELGICLLFMDRYAEAEPHLKQAAIDHKYGDAGDVLTMLVIALVRQNKLDDAKTYMQQFYDRKCASVFETQMRAEYQARLKAQSSGGRKPR